MYVVKSEFTMKKDKICIIYPEWACKTEMKDFWRYISKNQTSKRDVRGMCQKQQTVLKNAASDSMRILSNLKSRPNLTIGLIWALPGIVVLILLQLTVCRPLRVWWNPTFSCTVCTVYTVCTVQWRVPQSKDWVVVSGEIMYSWAPRATRRSWNLVTPSPP